MMKYGERQNTEQASRPGIYVHVPFCLKKCPYCDFYSVTDTNLMPDFLEALVREAAMVPKPVDPADTIYIGGGTPSLLEEDQLRTVLDSLYREFDIKEDAEVTLEANPGTVGRDKLEGCRRAGVNRLNIGVQSFSDRFLKFLGRIHSARQSEQALESAAEAGFKNIGLDLIYAVPGQTLRDLEEDLDRALEFSPAHLSCYMLSFPRRTPIARQLEQKAFEPLPEELCRDMFLLVHDRLVSRGWTHYEISNFCSIPALRSRHNMKYWSFEPYTGLGPAAHSYSRPERWWNVASVEEYTEALKAGRLPAAGQEKLSPEQEMIEEIYLGLRCDLGIAWESFNKRFNADFYSLFGSVLPGLEKSGYIRLSDGRWVLTRTGMLYADSIAGELAAEI